MTAPQVLPHRDAVLAALQGAGLAVGLGGRPETVPASGGYVVLFFSPGEADTESLADERTNFAAPFQVTACGRTEEVCLWVVDKVRQALHVAPAVPGRKVWRPEEQGGPPLSRDDDVTPPVYYVPMQYTIRSVPS